MRIGQQGCAFITPPDPQLGIERLSERSGAEPLAAFVRAVAVTLLAESVAVVIASRDGNMRVVASRGDDVAALVERVRAFERPPAEGERLVLEDHGSDVGGGPCASATFAIADGGRGGVFVSHRSPRGLSGAQLYVFAALARQVAAALESPPTHSRPRPPDAETERLPANPRALERVVAHARDAVAITDLCTAAGPPGRVAYVNASFTQATGYSAAEAIGKAPETLHGVAANVALQETIRAAFDARRPLEIEITNERKDGSRFRCELSIVPIADDAGHLTHCISVQRDVTVREAARLALPAPHALPGERDALTGLCDRAGFMQRLERAAARARSDTQYGFTLLVVDFDRFRSADEVVGYRNTAKVLRIVARRLELCTRANDTLARMGGDEFAVLLDATRGVVDAIAVARRIETEVGEFVRLDDRDIAVGASIGIVQWSERRRDAKSLLHDADTALRRVREDAGTGYLVFTESMHERETAFAHLQRDLRGAVEREELRVHYQPLVDIAAAHVYGFEALVRWQHPERGLVSPLDFIPLAERTGSIVGIGAWVMRRAVRMAHAWQQLTNVPLSISVNVSSRQLRDPQFYDLVAETLREYDVPPNRLQLEITESVFLGSAASVGELLRRIRALGVRIALDDFGTGYSSLSYLERNQVDVLKIDQSFVARIGDTSAKSEIVRMIVALADSLGVGVVAEGVENETQSAALFELGCIHLQGYHFSRPIPEDDVAPLIAARWNGRPELAKLLFETTPQRGSRLSPAQRNELRLQAAAAAATHELWKQRLHDAIRTGQSTLDVNVVARPDVCPIGIWLSQTISEPLKEMPLYGVTLARHAVFHRSAARLLALALARDPAAQAAFDTGGDFATVAGTLLEALEDWLAVAMAGGEDDA